MLYREFSTKFSLFLKYLKHAKHVNNNKKYVQFILMTTNIKFKLILYYALFHLECEPGRYGSDCMEVCGNCKNEYSSCDIFSGYCRDGCSPGYYPPLCKESKFLFMC